MATITQQQKFTTVMKAYLAENKGGFLREFCEIGDATGGESYTFTRIKESTAVDGLTSMFTGAVDNTGNMDDKKATIGYISAMKKLPKSEMDKTAIDIKSGLIKSLGNAVDRLEDKKITTACVGTTVVNIGEKPMEEVAKRIVGEIATTLAMAEVSTEGKVGVALVINKKDWGKIARTDYVLNSDYGKSFGGHIAGMGGNFFGAKVVPSNDDTTVPEGTVLIIPSGAIGLAEWKGSNTATAEYYASDAMSYHLQAVRAIGAVALDPKAIVKCTFTEPAGL